MVIQLILSGDFFQLPPIPIQSSGGKILPKFAFEAESWESCIDTISILRKVFRQSDEGACYCYVNSPPKYDLCD